MFLYESKVQTHDFQVVPLSPSYLCPAVLKCEFYCGNFGGYPMAIVEYPQPNRIRYPRIETMNLSPRNSCGVRSEREIVEEVETRMMPAQCLKEDVIFVALGKYVKESETILMWALHKSEGRKICILHVHKPAQKIPMMSTKVAISVMEENQVKAYHDAERQDMLNILDKYIQTCERAGVQAEKLWKEKDCIENGIVELISDNGIKWLVMGEAANRSYSKRMKEPKSKKANHVREEAPGFCHIWFICRGNLIQTRASKYGVITEMESPGFPASPSIPASPASPASPSIPESPNIHASRIASSWRSFSIADVGKGQMDSQNLVRNYRRIRSENFGMLLSSPSSGSGGISPQSPLIPELNSDPGRRARRVPSIGSHCSAGSSSKIITEETLSLPLNAEGNETGLGSPLFQWSDDDHHLPSIASSALETSNDLYDRLQQFVDEAETSRKEVYEESIKRKKAEKDVIDAMRRAKSSETMYSEDLRRRKEVDAALAKAREETERARFQLDEVIEEIKIAEEQKFSLECQIAESDKIVEELERKIFSAVELLQKYKQERNELQVECDNTLKEAEELRKKQSEEASSSSQLFLEFSFSEIKEATNNFSLSLKIGEGGYGSIYRGNLRHTQVAIKMLNPSSSQGPCEFQQEVNILSKLRHPNIVTLIGACPEAWALIYEYVPNGSLEDCLNCKNNSPPLSWKARIRIATELCSALMFLHSCCPQGVVHGDLKPANILIDANYVSKLSDFGICRELSQDWFSENNTTQCCWTEQPKGTFAYIDPEFVATGDLTSKSDVYSFGVILLRLLTGKPSKGIAKEVQHALDNGNLKEILDPTAGDWPFVQAKQLAHLAVSCADINRRRRPNLASEVWKVLEPMKVSCRASSLHFGSDERHNIPSYFVCPIFQEIMQDPVVAADGFTYESEALKGWLENGHDTSPMTNLLLAHSNLVPNHALRSAIQEWLQKR